MGVMENLTREDNILMPSYRKISGRLGFYRKASSYILKDNFLFKDGEALDDIDLGKMGGSWFSTGGSSLIRVS